MCLVMLKMVMMAVGFALHCGRFCVFAVFFLFLSFSLSFIPKSLKQYQIGVPSYKHIYSCNCGPVITNRIFPSM